MQIQGMLMNATIRLNIGILWKSKWTGHKTPFLERGPSWIVVMSRMLGRERKKLQSFTNWTTTHIWHGLFWSVIHT